MRKLPPLKALRAFEAAGRHLSLSSAADELHVTAGAVSQQVKLLEDFLSTKLFDRLHRKVVLTDAGKLLLPGINTAFDQILLALSRVEQFDLRRPLTVSGAPSFAGKWLVPRLREFNLEYPDIDVRIDTSTQLVDLAHSDIDIGIRFGSGDYPGLETDYLLSQEVFPVCAPGLLNTDFPLTKLENLKHYRLLHNDFSETDLSWPDWQMWLAAAGVKNIDFTRGPRFVQIELLVDAAIQGQGVALAGSVSVANDLASGRLIKPFELTFPLQFAYYFVTHESKSSDPRIKAFRRWVLDQTGNKSA